MKKRLNKSSLEAIRNYGFTKDVYREELMTQLEQLNILGEEMEKVIMVGNGRAGGKEITGLSGSERIRTSNSNGCKQYYFYDPARHKKRYAKVSELQQIIESAQKEYDTKAFEKIRKLKDTLQKFLKKYDIEEIEKIYDNYCKTKQEIISPLILPKESFIKEWREKHPGNQNTYPTEILYQTALGENVRSKSEKIIADLFSQYHVPYQFEPELILDNGHRACPDFVVLNVRSRKAFYWEHLGMISNSEYAIKSLKKLSLYEQNGLYVGKKLIVSMESETMPLDVKIIEKKIRTYLT